MLIGTFSSNFNNISVQSN